MGTDGMASRGMADGKSKIDIDSDHEMIDSEMNEDEAANGEKCASTTA